MNAATAKQGTQGFQDYACLGTQPTPNQPSAMQRRFYKHIGSPWLSSQSPGVNRASCEHKQDKLPVPATSSLFIVAQETLYPAGPSMFYLNHLRLQTQGQQHVDPAQASIQLSGQSPGQLPDTHSTGSHEPPSCPAPSLSSASGSGSEGTLQALLCHMTWQHGATTVCALTLLCHLTCQRLATSLAPCPTIIAQPELWYPPS